MSTDGDQAARRMTIAEAVRWLGCNEKTIRRRIEADQIDAVMFNGRWLVSSEQIEQERKAALAKFGIHDPPPPDVPINPADARTTGAARHTAADSADATTTAGLEAEVNRLRSQLDALREAARVLVLGLIDT